MIPKIYRLTASYRENRGEMLLKKTFERRSSFVSFQSIVA